MTYKYFIKYFEDWATFSANRHAAMEKYVNKYDIEELGRQVDEEKIRDLDEDIDYRSYDDEDEEDVSDPDEEDEEQYERSYACERSSVVNMKKREDLLRTRIRDGEEIPLERIAGRWEACSVQYLTFYHDHCNEEGERGIWDDVPGTQVDLKLHGDVADVRFIFWNHGTLRSKISIPAVASRHIWEVQAKQVDDHYEHPKVSTNVKVAFLGPNLLWFQISESGIGGDSNGTLEFYAEWMMP